MLRKIVYFGFSVIIGCLVLSIGSSSSAKVKELTVRGYITEIHSDKSFSIDDFRLWSDQTFEVNLENQDNKNIKDNPSLYIRIGALVKVKCKCDTVSMSGQILEVKIDVSQFRKYSKTVVLEQPPIGLTANPDGSYSGTIVADGKRIVVGPQTTISFKLNKKEEQAVKKENERKAKVKPVEPPAEPKVEVTSKNDNLEDPDSKSDANKSADFDEEFDFDELVSGSKPLQSLRDIEPGVYMTYKGSENADGAVIATNAVFIKNEKSKSEAKLWKESKKKEKLAKSSELFAKLKIGDDEYKVLNDPEVQKYIDDLVQSLVPEFQRTLDESDENKLMFDFSVVYEKKMGVNAAAYPTGAGIVNYETFLTLENEAQLAFVVGHEVAHSVQEHSFRSAEKNKRTRTGLFIGSIFARAAGYGLIADVLSITRKAMETGYQQNLENQADRIGLGYMIAAGFDPRQAPRAWRVKYLEEGERRQAFWNSHPSNAERRSYLMATLRNTYSKLDYSSLTEDSAEFQRIKSLIAEKYGTKKKATP